jgi:hypothetical protein
MRVDVGWRSASSALSLISVSGAALCGSTGVDCDAEEEPALGFWTVGSGFGRTMPFGDDGVPSSRSFVYGSGSLSCRMRRRRLFNHSTRNRRPARRKTDITDAAIAAVRVLFLFLREPNESGLVAEINGIIYTCLNLCFHLERW